MHVVSQYVEFSDDDKDNDFLEDINKDIRSQFVMKLIISTHALPLYTDSYAYCLSILKLTKSDLLNRVTKWTGR